MTENPQKCGICRGPLSKTGSCPRCDQRQKELVYRIREIEEKNPETKEDELEL